MALSPKQISDERYNDFKNEVEQCEIEIDNFLRQLWKYDLKNDLNITFQLNKYERVKETVIENYQKAGWKISQIQFGPSYPVNYFIRQS